MELPKPVAALGLLGLLLLDIILIGLVFWPGSASIAGTATPAATTPAQATAPSESATPNAPEEPDVSAVVPVTRIVSATSATDAWLADAGSCGEPGSVYVTVTGGDEWSVNPLPGSATRLRPSDGGSAFVVGGDADCEARVWYTADRGETWGAPQSVANAWGRDPDNAQLVRRPGGEPVQPCGTGEILDLVALVSASSALCADGGIQTSTDRGESWTTTARREGLTAISLTAVGEGAAAGLEEGCAGVAVIPLVGGSLGESVCVEDASYAPGQVAISVTAGAVWLVAGDDVMRAPQLSAPFQKVSDWPGS